MSDLRPLETLPFVPRPVPNADIGVKGELRWLPLRELYIDPAYQRTIFDRGRANVKRIIEAFSWDLFAALVVAPRGKNKYAIIDGQHRATAALAHGGITEVPCLVLTGGQALEARAFASINGNVTRLHLLQTFRASFTAQDPAAVSLVAFCTAANVTIAPYPKQNTAPGETMALGTVQSCRKRYGDQITAAALKLIRQGGEGALLLKTTIAGACQVFGERPDLVSDLPAHIAAMKRRGLGALHAEALRRRSTRGGTEISNFAVVLKTALEAPAQQTTTPRAVVAEGSLGDPGEGRSWWDRKKAVAELKLPEFLIDRGHEARALAGGLNFMIDGCVRDLKWTLELANKYRRQKGMAEFDKAALLGGQG